MMPNKEKLRERFLRDPLPRSLGGLAATLGRISSNARESTDPLNKDQRTLLSVQAKHWSDRALDFSGLLKS